jgi:SAM-dependent methyltransferase
MSNTLFPQTHNDWFKTPAGRYVAKWALSSTETLLIDVFGMQAAQVGCESLDLLATNRVQHRFRCLTSYHGVNTAPFGTTPLAVEINASALPFESDSMDLIVLPFMLEVHPDPHQVLREAYRVLRPEGQLIILGFNPLSLWGVRNYLSRLATPDRTNFPWPGNYLSVLRLKDWLKLLDFEVARGHFGCYAPPCNRDSTYTHFNWLELAGNRWWAFAGACYAVTAIKRIPGMTLLTPSWVTNAAKINAKASLLAEKNQKTSS